MSVSPDSFGSVVIWWGQHTTDRESDESYTASCGEGGCDNTAAGDDIIGASFGRSVPKRRKILHFTYRKYCYVPWNRHY